MFAFSATPAFSLAVAVSQAAFLDEIPMSLGAVFLYGLVAVSVVLVVFFGLKKPKGPGGVGHT